MDRVREGLFCVSHQMSPYDSVDLKHSVYLNHQVAGPDILGRMTVNVFAIFIIIVQKNYTHILGLLYLLYPTHKIWNLLEHPCART